VKSLTRSEEKFGSSLWQIAEPSLWKPAFENSLHTVATCDRHSAKASAGTLLPFGFGDGMGFGGQVMIQDKFTDSCAFGDTADLVDIRVERGHSSKVGASKTVALQIVEVGHLVHEDIGASGESYELIVHCGIT
jgi:hypothetical protein